MSEYETEIQYNNKHLCPSSSGKCGYRPNHPCPFLKATTREEKFFGDNLFRDWRYNPDGSLNKDFVLNNPIYGGEILVTGKNFGSGSSREHAAWAIAGYGFRVVVF